MVCVLNENLGQNAKMCENITLPPISSTGQIWHIFWCQNGNFVFGCETSRVHSMDLGQKIFSEYLTFYWHSGVLSSLKSVLGVTVFQNLPFVT